MISVVMPTLNEQQVLPKTLAALLSQPGDFEVIVVDGGSTDGTREIVEKFRVESVELRVGNSQFSTHHSPLSVLTAPRGRASQMNAGAAEARGEWLLFLHADTLLPDGALARLNAMEPDVSVQAGGFRHRFSGTDCRLRAVSWLDNFRCRRSRVIYGDQALFVRRALFRAVGGFPDQPILEDVAICERLSAHTTLILLDAAVVTDPRKFLAMGIGRSFLRVLLIILHVQFRLPVLPRVFFQDVR
jgi:rSAM/selenodomain-associated transferase 2